MIDILVHATQCFNTNSTIQPILNGIVNMAELDKLTQLVKYRRGSFYRTARKEIKQFIPKFTKQQTFRAKVKLIPELICVPHLLRNGDISLPIFHQIARALATGAIRELPIRWSGLISQNAINASSNIISQTNKITKSTYLKSHSNTYEHFYNNLFAAYIMLCYLLYFTPTNTILEQLCDVFRQVHITTTTENSILSHNGQNAENRVGWKDQYANNNIELVDVGIIPVNILKLTDVASVELIDTAMKMRTKVRNATHTNF